MKMGTAAGYISINFWLIAALVITTFQAYGQGWAPMSFPAAKWRSITVSSDTLRLAAIASDNFGTSNAIYFSTNYGIAWYANAFPGGINGIWRSIASTADGTSLIAGITGGLAPIYTSTNSGTSWISNNTFKTAWISVASSGDGKALLAASFSSSIAILSTNSGNSWTPASLPVSPWDAVTCSADGQTLAVGGNAGPIYVSTNAGVSWVLANAPNQAWGALTASADGSLLAAAAFLPAGNIYVSTNRGSTWELSSAPTANWTSIACSATGKHILAAANGSGSGGAIFNSTNYGQSWISNSAPIKDWRSVAISADGGKRFAAAMNDLIYTSQILVPPELSISHTANEVTISWLVTSTNCLLFKNTNLTSSGWQVVTNTPVLNPANLRQQVSVPKAEEREYFLLQQP